VTETELLDENAIGGVSAENMLFHVSEYGGIERFEPRPSPSVDGAVVWTIHADRLHNYLLPRDCPRVTYYAGRKTTADDIDRFLGSSAAVIAVESAWFDRIRSCRLYCYEMPPETFACIDDCAAYFVSRQTVVPKRIVVVDDLISALLERGVELRFLPNLLPLRDAVAASTLRFSIIRIRNAVPERTAV
jgi:hypothetical protein